MRKRRKPSPDDEPLFEKRRRKKAEVRCQATNCRLPPAPDSDYCNVHALLFDGMKKLRDSSRKAAARGDFKNGILHGLASTGVDLLGQVFSNVGSPVAQVERVDWAGLFGRVAAPSTPPASRSCWEILGLDSATATADDIRAVQRKLAEIYHTDKGNKAIAASKLAEINAAASEALQQTK